MNIKSIVLIPTGGFGNRIKSIVSAKILSKYFNIKLYINWEKEECINVDYNDIFSDNPNRFDLNTINNYNYLFLPHIHTNEVLETLKVQTNDPNNNYDILVVQGGHIFKHPDIDLETFINYKKIILQRLSWKEDIIKQIYKQDPNNYQIGLHIRRFVEKFDEADNKNSNLFNQFKCTLDNYTNIIDKLINKNSNINIFLSTNCCDTRKLLLEKYSNNIKSRDINYNRNDKHDIINAVIDFLVLSRCKLIIGTHYSSFSDEACFFNLIPKYCVSDNYELHSNYAYHTYCYDNKTKYILYDENIINKFL